MKTLKYIALLPVLLLQYLFLFLLFSFLRVTDVFKEVFNESIANLLLFLLIFLLIALICAVVTFILSIVLKWDSRTTAFVAMMIKLLQIPAYIVIFVLGLLFAFMVFTMAFVPFFIIIDLITIFMTGLIGVSACIAGYREKKLSAVSATLFAIGQFFFCIDVVLSIIVYVKIRKAEKRMKENSNILESV